MRASMLPHIFRNAPIAASNVGDYIVYSLVSDETIALETGLEAGGSKVTLDNVVHIDSGTYTASGGTITIGHTGLYWITAHMAADRGLTGIDRSGAECKIAVNGTVVSGCTAEGFIRRNGSADECDRSAYGFYELAAGDTVELWKQRSNLTGSDARLVGASETYNTSKTSLTIVRMRETQDTLILEATAANDINPQTNDVFVDTPWSTQTKIDTASYGHTIGSPDVTIKAIGKYLVMYADMYRRTTDTSVRTGVVSRMYLGGARIPGTDSCGYLRGVASASNNSRRSSVSACTIIETTSINQVIKVAVSGEAGNIPKERLTGSSRLCIYRLSGTEDSFRARSLNLASIGGGAKTTLVYDISDWMSGYTLVGNEVVAGAGAHMVMHAVVGNNGEATRGEIWQRPELDNGTVAVPYIGGSCYVRNALGMEIASPTFAGVVTLPSSQTIRVANNSRAGTGTLPRALNTGAFCGIDLSTL